MDANRDREWTRNNTEEPQMDPPSREALSKERSLVEPQRGEINIA
jgi:hypothetical protein